MNNSNNSNNDLLPAQGVVEDDESMPIPMNNRAKNITIEPLDHGYIVNIGCQWFASEDAKKMLELIGVYLQKPSEIEKKWFNKEFKLK